VHFVGGIVGVLLIGLLATEVMTSGPQGFFYGDGFRIATSARMTVQTIAHPTL
jgi:Amt family ammonium transporter